MKNKKAILYDYIVHSIGEENDPAYQAYIPAFNSYVFGENQKELEDGIRSAIEVDIEIRKKKKIPIPLPESEQKKSGKLVLRIPPALHGRLSFEAQARGKSLNTYLQEKILA